MERRRAIAWAGSIAMTGCVGALVLGSLVGGFGLGPSPAQEIQVDNPLPSPGPIAPGGVPGGTQVGPVLGGTQPAPAPGSPPAVQTDPRSPTGGRRFPASVPISPFDVTANTGDGPGPKVGLGVPCARCGPADTTTARSSHTTEVPSDRDAPSYRGATGNRPEPTNEVSPPKKTPATPTTVDTRPAGGDLDQDVKQSQTPTTPPKVDATRPGGGARGRGRDRLGIAGTASRVDISRPSVARGKKSVSGRAPRGDGKPGAGSRVVDGVDGRGG